MKKKCSSCKEIKPLEEFCKNNSRKDGYHYRCKMCHYEPMKKWRRKNKEKIKKDFQKWAEENREYRQKYQKKWQEETRYSTKWKYKRILEWIPIVINIFGKVECFQCGYDKNFAAFHFHHRNPEEKEYKITSLLRSKVNSERKKELEKCEILCSNCHIVKHLKNIELYEEIQKMIEGKNDTF